MFLLLRSWYVIYRFSSSLNSYNIIDKNVSIIFTGLGICDKVSIRIEPSFFERLWSQAPFPEFMTDDELIAAGYNIDITYKPMISRDELKNRPEENADEYYTRNYEIVERALQFANEQGKYISFDCINVMRTRTSKQKGIA